MTIGWLIITAAFISNNSLGEFGKLDVHGWIAMVFLGIFCAGLAYIAWFDALSQLPAAQTGAFLFIEPLASMAVAAIVLNEQITLVSVFGGAVILYTIGMPSSMTIRYSRGISFRIKL